MSIIAVDANVWYSVTLTDLLLTLTESDRITIVTSAEALDEAERNTAHIPGASARIAAVRRYLGDNVLNPPELLRMILAPITQINPKDRHVYAAAIDGGATVIITEDRAFSRELEHVGFNSQNPDSFLTALANQSPFLIRDAFVRMAHRRNTPPLTVEEIHNQYRTTAPRFYEASAGLVIADTPES